MLTDVPIVSQVTNLLLLPLKRVVEKLLVSLTGSNWGMATQNNPPALECAVFTAMIMSIVSLLMVDEYVCEIQRLSHADPTILV